MTFHLASDIGEVLEAALVDGPARTRWPDDGRRAGRPSTPAGSAGLRVSRAVEEAGEDAGQLHGLVPLDAVAGTARP